MEKLWGFAYITLRENLRRKSLYGVVVAYLISIIFARILMEFSLQDLTKFFLDFTYSFLTFFLVVSTLFIATDIMGKDIEKKALYVILSKGISRDMYIIGRAFSFLLLTLLMILVLGSIFVVFTKAINFFTPEAYSKEILILPSVLVLLVLWLKLFLLSTFVLFLSSFITTFFLVFLVGAVIYLAGSSVENLYHFVLVNEKEVGSVIKSIITFLFYILPNFSSLGPDAILGTEAIRWKRVFLDIAKTLTYSLFLLSVSVSLFRRRELP